MSLRGPRRRAHVARRLRGQAASLRSALPEHKPIDSFDFAVAHCIDAKLVLELARGKGIARAGSALLNGSIGTGKTHLAIALGIEAGRQLRRVAFWRAADLVRTLTKARDARERSRVQRRLGRVQLLIID